jgi:hypothetical protein
MGSTRLCQRCTDFQLNEILDRLDDGDLEDIYRISHAEFFEFAPSCDICEATGRYFLEQRRLETDAADGEQAYILASVRKDGKDGKDGRLIFYYIPGWHMANWMVWTSKGQGFYNVGTRFLIVAMLILCIRCASRSQPFIGQIA